MEPLTRTRQDSPLAEHLLLGAVITQVDDTLLAGAQDGEVHWTAYLSESGQRIRAALRWCAAQE